ncbi:MAG: hypothetical protein NTW59_01675 [Candidatus Diapherotrites archaeon]|nr:hypothetical protein [Candidatus Diapherotrites archaeon]
MTSAKGALGYVGGTVTFAGKEKKPSFFVQCIEVRGEYYRIPKAVRRRYGGWQKRWVGIAEQQCRAMGFERMAIIPSTDKLFLRRDVRIQPETKKALYATLPESMGYRLETLSVPTSEGMREAQYYTKKLG